MASKQLHPQNHRHHHHLKHLPHHHHHHYHPYSTALPNLQSQFLDDPQHASHTLPPLGPQRGGQAGLVNGLLDHYYFLPHPQHQQRQQQPSSSYTPGTGNAFTGYGAVNIPYSQQYQQYPNESPSSSTSPSSQLGQSLQSLLPIGHSQSAAVHLQPLRPMPIGLGQTLPTPLPPSQSFAAALPFATPCQPRAHVVGSQGRRGILPSDDGRPAAVNANGSPAVKAPAPVKDADGKFPCPHCNKNYLHAKHLKRHLLRHTGDRPYSCFLCQDTFSRSDILKRHFQKCSIRRGNPTGATHLSHSQFHLRKQPAKRTPPDSNVSSPVQTGPVHEHAPFGGTEIGLGLSGVLDSPRSVPSPASRSDSGKRFVDGMAVRDRRSMTGPVPLSLARANVNHPANLPITPSLSSTGPSTPLTSRGSAHFAPNGSSQDAFNNKLNHPPAADTCSIFNPHSMPAMPTTSQAEANVFDWSMLQVKTEVPNHDEFMTGLFGDSSHSNGMTVQNGYASWHLPHLQAVTRHNISDRLLLFLQLEDVGGQEERTLRYLLTEDNVNHFLQKYCNFQTHWPSIHMPTFDPTTAYEGVVLAMSCIGAIYSDRADVAQVCMLMARVKARIEHGSQIGGLLQDPTADPGYLCYDEGAFEQLLSLALLLQVSFWHGDHEQRQVSMSQYPGYVNMVRRLRMLRPGQSGGPLYSLLHMPGAHADAVTVDNWNWNTWLWQEKRSRLVFLIFLVDVALVVYFNRQPNFCPTDIQLPLPADDAVWEAPTAHDCAVALGLHGPAAQEAVNISGSRRRRQPEMHQAMQALQNPTYDFIARSSNAYAKFILVHGIHLQIWFLQKQMSQEPAHLSLDDFVGANSPAPPSDWATHRSAGTSASNSGQATPTDGGGQYAPAVQRLVKVAEKALNKWKHMWDEDVRLQYPPSTPRMGFCRDGAPIFWLCKMLLRNFRSSDLHAPWDQRFAQMMEALKLAKRYVNSKHASRGEGPGAVGDIDESYGVVNVTFDMKLLFAPILPGHNSTSGLSPNTGIHMT